GTIAHPHTFPPSSSSSPAPLLVFPNPVLASNSRSPTTSQNCSARLVEPIGAISSAGLLTSRQAFGKGSATSRFASAIAFCTPGMQVTPLVLEDVLQKVSHCVMTRPARAFQLAARTR